MLPADASDPYTRAVHDPEFGARVAASYAGRHEVLDALWWLTHPNETAPSGAPSPAHELAQLQRLVYAQDGAAATGDASAIAAAAARLDQSHAQYEADRRAIEQAVIEANGAGLRDPHSRTPYSGATAGIFPAQPGLASGDPDAHDVTYHQDIASESPRVAAASTPRRFSAAALAFVAAVSVFVGIGIGNGALGSIFAPMEAQPASIEAQSSAVGGPAVLAVFDRAQAPRDIPTRTLPDRFRPESFRNLAELGTATLYAAQAKSGDVCALVVPADSYVVNCVAAHSFPERGLGISWSSPIVNSDGSVTAPVDWAVVWKQDGRVEPVNVRDLAVETAAQLQPLSLPPVDEAEVLRIAYAGQLEGSRGIRDAAGWIPAGASGYTVDLGCNSEEAGQLVSYQLTSLNEPDASSSSSTFECGLGRTDTSFFPDTSGGWFQLELTGELDAITMAYAVLKPVWD